MLIVFGYFHQACVLKQNNLSLLQAEGYPRMEGYDGTQRVSEKFYEKSFKNESRRKKVFI